MSNGDDDDSKGNENGKKNNTNSLRLTKNNFALDHAFLYISFPSLQYREMKMRLCISYPELRYSLFDLNPRAIFQHMRKRKSSVGISAIKFEAIRSQFL